MTMDDFEKWINKYWKFIRKSTPSGEFDRYGPIDEFSLVRDLQRQVDNLKRERAQLNPKGPVPTDEESRFRANFIDDKDALTAAAIDGDIAQLESLIREIEDTSRKFSDLGKKGGVESAYSRQVAAMNHYAAWKESAQAKHRRNPSVSCWEIAGLIAEAYINRGTGEPYSQRTVYNVIKEMDCFKKN